jgi:hypothetical protein
MPDMPIRVAHVGTGNVGRPALRQIIEDERFELTHVWVSNPDKIGKDAGELCGNGMVTGITATGDLAAILAGPDKPEVVLYCAMGDTRLFEAFADAKQIIEAGCHFIGTSPGTLLYPQGTIPDDWWQPLDQAARDAGVSVFVNGVDPGFIGDLLPLSLASTCREITHIRWCEIADYASYDGPEVLFNLMGFGSTEDQVPMLYQPGILGYAWGTSIRQLATGLGIEIDAITDSCERQYAEEAFEIASGTIEKGGLEAVRFFINGLVNGVEVITVEHVTRLRPDVRPDWRQPAEGGGSYRIEITGEPSYAVDVVLSSKDGDHNYSPILAGAGRVVNAIPAAIAAGPGILGTIDLPLPTSRGVFRLPG